MRIHPLVALMGLLLMLTPSTTAAQTPNVARWLYPDVRLVLPHVSADSAMQSRFAAFGNGAEFTGRAAGSARCETMHVVGYTLAGTAIGGLAGGLLHGTRNVFTSAGEKKSATGAIALGALIGAGLGSITGIVTKPSCE